MKFICPLIVVKDIDASRNFYEKIMGQQIEYDFGQNITFEGGFSIHLEEHYKDLLGKGHERIQKRANSFELYFETEELEGIIPKLKANKTEIIHEIKEQPWGQRVIRFYDPDDHIIEVGESMESVVLRYYASGKNMEEICDKTSLPISFVEKTIGTLNGNKKE
jgi:catechol 2,3-dioxygenase-like lactoylglutathione lyase family enzyme